MKKLFAEALWLSSRSYEFHELAIILEIDSEIKCAYHFKRKLEDSGYDLDLIKEQGYELEDIKDNPEDTFKIYSILSRLMAQYVNKSLPNDNFVLYTWDHNDTALAINRFLYENGSRDVNKYFLPHTVNIPSLLIDKLNRPLEDVVLSDLYLELYNSTIDKDALSRLVAIYKLYKYATT